MKLIPLFIIVGVLLAFAISILRISVFKKNTYKTPKNKRNIIFLIFSLIVLVALCIIASLLQKIALSILNIPVIGGAIAKVLEGFGNEGVSYIVNTVLAIVINLAILILYTCYKSIFARRIKKAEVTPVEDKPKDENESKGKKRLLFKFKHIKKSEESDEDKEDKKYKKDEFGDVEEVEKNDFGIKKFILGIFFVEPDFIHVKPWVYKCVKVLQFFIYILEIVYFA